MPRLGAGEIMLIMVVVLLLFGAKRIPEIGQSMGKGIREFKRSISGAEDALNGIAGEDTPPARMSDGAGSQNTGSHKQSSEPKRLSQ